MSRTIMQSTQVMIAIQVTGDREQELASLISLLTQAFGLLWQAYQVGREVIALAGDCYRAADFTVKVMAIGLSALAFGMGVRL